MPEKHMDLPYVSLLSGRDPVDVLRTTPEIVEGYLAGRSPETLPERPAPGRWSMREVICHLADCEIAWAWRLRQTCGQGAHVRGEGSEIPVLQGFDQDAWAEIYRGEGLTVEAAMAAWKSLRRWNVAFAEALTDEEKQRRGMRAEVGEVTVWNLLEIAAGHDLHHLAAMERNPRAREGQTTDA